MDKKILEVDVVGLTEINKCCGLKLARPDSSLTRCVCNGVVYMLVNLCHSLQHTQPSGVTLGCICNILC